MPITWSHDPHFPLHLFSKSFQAAKQGVYPSSLSIHFGLQHSHAAAWKPLEIYAFADLVPLCMTATILAFKS
ncbi:hypothetical protein GCM10008018_26380 [Paenibacillus marchantiophytorum]|uniref:Uncharacterized protein n=1 Tax=Paenibacillus marchantiophytorum TaxID=1619310 RepID=A0ABQ1EP36_9BACL|nr:hypothetical protein GCM10008018_26380 [Paenibacillus marchantiophytorum]